MTFVDFSSVERDLFLVAEEIYAEAAETDFLHL